MKNASKTCKTAKKYSYLRIDLNLQDLEYLRSMLDDKQHLLFPEGVIFSNFDKLKHLSELDKISSLKYRASKGKIIILEIAKSYVFLSLNSKTFDMVEHFRNLTQQYRVYKKEIQVLPQLVRYFFVRAVFEIEKELFLIRKRISNQKDSKINFSKKTFLDEEVYGVAKYSKHFHQLKFKFGVDEVLSTARLGERLLDFSSKLKACFLWLDVV